MENINYIDILQILSYIIAIMSIIANFTKTDADNKIVALLSKIVNILAINFRTK